MSDPRSQWISFLSRSLATRLDVADFKSFISILHLKYPLSPYEISRIFLAPTENNDFALDPRVPRYLQVLLEEGIVNVPSLMRWLAGYSTFGTQAENNNGTPPQVQDLQKTGEPLVKEKKRVVRWNSSYATDELLFYKMAKHVVADAHTKSAHHEPCELLTECKRWMKLVISAGHGDQDILNLGGHTHVEEMKSAIIAAGTLVVAVMDDAHVLKVLGRVKDAELGVVMATFVPLLAQTSPQNAGRLDLFRMQTLPTIQPKEKKEKEKESNASKEIDEILGEVGASAEMDLESLVVTDVPVVNTRAGLYIYLNSLVSLADTGGFNADVRSLWGGRLLTIMLYFHIYIIDITYGILTLRLYPQALQLTVLLLSQGEFQAAAMDLILASFDCLANVTFKNEKKADVFVFRSFLINKVPLLLSALYTSFYAHITAEQCITDALSLVDQNVFPTLVDTDAMFQDSVRQDFCFACCLHGLLQESSIEGLLGDTPMQSLPSGGRYQKDELVQQCLSDPGKAESMVDELDHMDGNVGALSQAIVEVNHGFFRVIVRSDLLR